MKIGFSEWFPLTSETLNVLLTQSTHETYLQAELRKAHVRKVAIFSYFQAIVHFLSLFATLIRFLLPSVIRIPLCMYVCMCVCYSASKILHARCCVSGSNYAIEHTFVKWVN